MQKELFPKSDEKWKHASQQITFILQKVKMKLISRELEQQKEAVAWLIKELNVNTAVVRDIFIITLLKSEIITLLCETTMTTEGRLVSSTLKCLASLSISEQFYKQNHASFVIASILRAGHFLTLQSNLSNDQLMMLESIAYALEKIFEGANKFRISLNEICELTQILRFFKKLLTAESQVYRIVFSVAKVLSFVLQYTKNDENLCNEPPEDGQELVFTIVDTVLKIMRKILEAKNSTDAKYAFRSMVMICAVSAAGISTCSDDQNNDSNIKEIGLFKSSAFTHRVNLANCIYSAMIESVIPNFDKIQRDERNGEFYFSFVTCLNHFYRMNYCKLKDLSNYLVGQGFLQTLPRLIIISTENLRSEILMLLSQILTILASDSLSIETWLGGAKQFQKFLVNGFKSLPHDPSTWLPFLSKGDARSDALIILFYHNFLGESTSTVGVYLPFIIDYLISTTKSQTKRKSITLLKSLWFTFSMAAVSHEDPSSIESYELGMTRLLNDLESAGIEQCYTHHPAVIAHCLKSNFTISKKLRTEVFYLWLEKGGDVGCIVDTTTEGDLTNYYCLMEMVKTGPPHTVDVAMEAIFELSDNPEALETLGNIAWKTLQEILTPGVNRDDHNIASVLKLAAMFEPNKISGLLLIRLLYCLTNFILEIESNLTLISLGIKNAYCLLRVSIRRNDVRGVTMFTNKPKLIKFLKNLAFDKENAGLSHLCFNCLSTLIQYQAIYSIECENTLEIESEELLDQLYLEDCGGALKFTMTIFSIKIERPLILLKNLFSEFDYGLVIRGIYLQLHMISAKSVSSEDRNLCFETLMGILNHCVTVNDLKVLKILCEIDWTYLLIEATVKGKQTMDSTFMDFVSDWLYHRSSITKMPPPCGDRACGRDQFETTLDLLGKSALTKFEESSEDTSVQELIQNLLFFQEHFSDNIGAELQKADEKLTKN